MDDNVMKRYTMKSDQARHYVQYDQGKFNNNKNNNNIDSGNQNNLSKRISINFF